LLPSGHRVIDSPDFPEAYKAEANAGVRFSMRCARKPGLDLPLAVGGVR
jgi:putative NADH-flavin reductase